MEIILAIAALAGLVWGLVLLTRGGLVAGCLAVLLAGCCFGHAFYHLPAGPIPLTLDRVLWVGMLGVYLVGLRQGWSDHKPLTWADVTLGAFLLVLLASTLTHDWRRNGNAPLAHLVFFYLMPLGVYWVARECRLSERTLNVILYSFMSFGVYLAVTAVAEVNQWWWAVYPQYIADPDYLEFFGRGRGPLLNPVASGFYQCVGLLAAMLLWRRMQKTGRIILMAVFFAFALGIFCTLTRSVWLGAALGAMIVV
ncbi:MAG TPA: hypothetical protein VJL29_15530, partial [Thermoguttaceae bacterium]|nr:hypothetical protein [Thermoguttaceae bacterium]